MPEMASNGKIASASIQGLPAEILSHIFLYLPKLTEDFNLDGPLTVSRVCRRWRGIALQCKTLWTNVPIHDGLELTKLALECSKPLPIMFEVLPGDMTTTRMRAVQLALREMERVQDLILRLDNVLNVDVDEVLQTMASPAPMLESLTLVLLPQDGPCFFSEQIFSGVAPPRLRHLELGHCTIDPTLFPAGPPNQLRTLVLQDCSLVPAVSILQAPLTSLRVEGCTIWGNLGQLLKTLSKVPNLTELALVNVKTSEPGVRILNPDTQGGPSVLELEHLTKFTLEDYPSHISIILPALHLSLSTDIRIRCTGRSMNDSQYVQRIGVALTAHFFRPSAFSIQFQRLVLSYATPRLPDILISGSSFPCHDSVISFVGTSLPHGQDPDIALGTFHCAFKGGFSHRYDESSTSDPAAQWLRMLVGSTPTQRVDVLHVDGVPTYNDLTAWTTLHEHSNYVRKVCAAGLAAHGLVGALEKTGKAGAFGLFPRLEEVCITRADLRDDDNALLGNLQTAMYALEEGKRTPKNLRLEECTFGPGMIDVLRRTLEESVVLAVHDPWEWRDASCSFGALRGGADGCWF